MGQGGGVPTTDLLFVFTYTKTPPNMEIIKQNVQGKLRKIIIVADEAETLLELNAPSEVEVLGKMHFSASLICILN